MENNELTQEALRRAIRRVQDEKVHITLNGMVVPIGVEYNFYAEVRSLLHAFLPELIRHPSSHHIVTASRGTPPDEIAAISILHELGHAHQWMEGWMTLEKHKAAKTRDGWPRRTLLEMEEDAWMRAFDLADELDFDPCGETLQYAQNCLTSYVEHWQFRGCLD